ncbi:hypothetical protein IMCC3088_1882 [Aequoribacter fuscus]|uniref:Uncharacterized protein n=1 Tax=Aequoribacter fuscus TaxID=2518989 RepID=F3L2V8_9GAMM|nr:hypothetical protein [Aequoribacter fuscus]EGG29309.1 hypothetical protein IMCC3088_1882 [Aequoribacter fuscus]QHJ87844.1 hypothetical protein EYZ66_05815 [Aequoribacter fuscus]
MLPPMTLLGWIHTVLGVVAIASAVICLYRYHFLSVSTRSGKIYLIVTVLVAGSALAIYNQGGFNIAHMLAILTLAAAGFGYVMERWKPLGGLSVYAQALGYSSTLLFHMIPAITDFLRRLPVGDPFVDSFTHPLLQGFHLAFLVLFLVGYGWQCVRLRGQQ